MIRTLPIALGFLLAVAVGNVCAQTQGTPAPQKKRPSKPAQQQKAKPAPKKLSLTDLTEAVKLYSDSEDRVIYLINQYGLDFKYSQADLDKLKAAGATDQIIAAVKSHAEPVPPPPKPPAGTILVVCAPLECNIALNGTGVGQTVSGELPLHDIAPGEVVLDISRPGFMSQQHSAKVEAGKQVRVAVTLQPDVKTKENYGKAMLASAIKALGGEKGILDGAWVSSAGTMTIAGGNKLTTEWSVALRMKPPDRLRAEVKSASGGRESSIYVQGSNVAVTGHLKGKPEGDEVAMFLRRIRAYQLPAILEYLLTQTKVQAIDPMNESKRVLRADAGADVYAAEFNADWTPAAIRYQPRVGVGEEAVFSNYVKLGATKYPKTMAIRTLDTPSRGLELHLQTVDLNRDLTDKEFEPKGGFFKK